MPQRLAIASILIVLQSVLLACDAPEPFDRLVDHAQRVGAVSEPDTLLVRSPAAVSDRADGTSVLPTATIGDDTRLVLASYPHHLVADRDGLTTTKDDHVAFRKPLGGRFPGAEHLLIDVRSAVFGHLGDWKTEKPLLVPVGDLGRRQILAFELDLEDTPAGSMVQLWVDAYQAPPVGGTRYVTPTRLVPENSSLEFGIGIMEAARYQGPVRFSVSACAGEDCELLFSEVLDPEIENRSPWQDRRITLDSVWGEERALEFEAIPERPDAMSLPLWANPTVLVEPDTRARPNVVFVSIDTLRRDRLGVYGYETETSPFISDVLAPRGVVFDNVLSEAGTTDASHMTMFTGLPALVHGVTTFEGSLSVPVVTLAEAFRDEGYATAAFTEGGPLSHRVRFNIGFDRWVENLSKFVLFPVGEVDLVLEQGWDWIAMKRTRPFFLFLHTFQVHHPLSPPVRYRKYFLEDDVVWADQTEEFQELKRYDQEIRYVDDELAEFWTKLETHGLAENTILVVTSDHGEKFWEHGDRFHGGLPYEEILEIPLIMVGPGIASGIRSQRPLHHIDFMSTILELADVPVPEHGLGQSFADVVKGEEGADADEVPSRVRTSASWFTPGPETVPMFTIRDSRLKVIRYEKDARTFLECFDLERDPDERTNLCADGPTDEAKDLLSKLEGYESAMEATRVSLGGTPGGSGRGGKVTLSPEQEAQLRALGYVE